MIYNKKIKLNKLKQEYKKHPQQITYKKHTYKDNTTDETYTLHTPTQTTLQIQDTEIELEKPIQTIHIHKNNIEQMIHLQDTQDTYNTLYIYTTKPQQITITLHKH